MYDSDLTRSNSKPMTESEISLISDVRKKEIDEENDDFYDFNADIDENNLKLKDYQEPHFNKLSDALTGDLKFAIDASAMGGGKTPVSIITTISLGNYYNIKYNLIIVAKGRSLVDHWVEYTDPVADYFNSITIMSYEALRGTSISGINSSVNKLLTSTETYDGPIFSITKKFKKLIKHGAMLIFDEAHSLKNLSRQHQAARELIKYIRTRDTNSRILFLSGTPFDKDKLTYNMFHLLCMCKEKVASYNIDLNVIYDGFYQVIKSCRKIDKKTTDRIVLENLSYVIKNLSDIKKISNDKVNNLLLDLYIEIIVKNNQSEMILPKIRYTRDIANGFYKISSEREKNTLTDSIMALRDLVIKYINNDSRRLDFGKVTKLLKDISLAKYGILKRIIKGALRRGNELGENRTIKIIIVSRFKDVLTKLYDKFSDKHAVLLLNGDIKQEERQEVINNFQDDKKLKYKILLMTTQVGGTGLNLQDLTGNAPRELYIIPDFNATDLHQATGRIFRPNMQSQGKARFVYGDLDNELTEEKIIESLIRKKEIMGKITSKQLEQGISFMANCKNIKEDY